MRSTPPTSSIQRVLTEISVMVPKAGGSRLEHHSMLIGNEVQNLGWRTLHLEMSLSTFHRRNAGISLFGWTNLDKEMIVTE